MCSALRRAPPNLEELLDWERRQDERYEFVDGILRAMVGGTLAHNTIAGNIFAALKARLRGGPCRAFVEGPKVVTADSFLYPDVVVSCTPAPPASDVVPEPVVIVEVLSRSTADHDHGAKWRAYQTLPSLRCYLLVAQDRIEVETFTRDGAGWHYARLTDPGAAIELPPLGVTLTLAEIYEESGAAA